MQKHLILTIIAADRPGLVETLASCVESLGGNWLESRLARLAGQFAGIVEIQVPAESVDALKRSMEELSHGGIRVDCQESDWVTEEDSQEPVMYSVVGNDRPGIVRQIAEAIASEGGNIVNLDTGLDSAPWSGESLFRATYQVVLSPNQSAEELRLRLEGLADDLIIETPEGH